MNRLLTIAATVTVLGGGALWWMDRATPSSTLLELPGAAGAQEAAAEVDMSLAPDMTLGDPDAPVTVVEYASFTCPHCMNFHETNFSKLKADYIDTGKVHFIYREVYFDRYGLWAGLLARCGGSTERYFGMVELLYDQQAEWLASRDPAGIADALKQIGRQSGLSDAEFDACMQDRDKAQALIAAYQQNATADGVNSTPSFVVNGKLVPNQAWEDLAAEFDAAGAN